MTTPPAHVVAKRKLRAALDRLLSRYATLSRHDRAGVLAEASARERSAEAEERRAKAEAAARGGAR